MGDPDRLARVVRSFDRSSVDGLAAIAREQLRVAGGLCGAGWPGTWVNQAVGLAYDRPITPDELAVASDFYESRDVRPTVEAHSREDPSLLACLAGAGYRIAGVEEVWHADLRRPVPGDTPRGIVVRELDRDDPAAVDDAVRFLEMARTGDDDAAVNEARRELWRTLLQSPVMRAFVPEVEGEPAGFGAIMLTPPPDGCPRLAQLFAGSVRAGFRRRGVHKALMLTRLRAARRAGCESATVAGDPGGPTARNAVRLAMTLLCLTATFERSP